MHIILLCKLCKIFLLLCIMYTRILYIIPDRVVTDISPIKYNVNALIKTTNYVSMKLSRITVSMGKVESQLNVPHQADDSEPFK